MSKLLKVLLILVSVIWTVWSITNAFLNSGVMNLLPEPRIKSVQVK